MAHIKFADFNKAARRATRHGQEKAASVLDNCRDDVRIEVEHRARHVASLQGAEAYLNKLLGDLRDLIEAKDKKGVLIVGHSEVRPVAATADDAATGGLTLARKRENGEQEFIGAVRAFYRAGLDGAAVLELDEVSDFNKGGEVTPFATISAGDVRLTVADEQKLFNVLNAKLEEAWPAKPQKAAKKTARKLTAG